MPKYTTRIELHNAIWPEDYADLQKLMSKQGFSNYIEDTKGQKYKLPSGEFNKITDDPIDLVYTSAATAARATGKTFSILITEGSRQWQLEEMK